MTTKTKYRLKPATRDSYLELVTDFALASIQSEEHFHEAQKVMDRLLAKAARQGRRIVPRRAQRSGRFLRG